VCEREREREGGREREREREWQWSVAMIQSLKEFVSQLFFVIVDMTIFY
jgi:hypothetical protein